MSVSIAHSTVSLLLAHSSREERPHPKQHSYEKPPDLSDAIFLGLFFTSRQSEQWAQIRIY